MFQKLTADGPKLIVLEFRKLGRAKHRVIAHKERRIDFGVAMLLGVNIEHELAERTFKPRQAPLQHDKARAGKLCSRRKIHVAKRVTKVVVRL